MPNIYANWDNSKGLCVQVGKTGKIFTGVNVGQLIKLCSGREKIRFDQRRELIRRHKK